MAASVKCWCRERSPGERGRCGERGGLRAVVSSAGLKGGRGPRQGCGCWKSPCLLLTFLQGDHDFHEGVRAGK